MRTLSIVGALLGSLVGAVSAALFGWWLSYPTTYYTLGWCTITQAMDEYEQPWPFLLAMPLGGSLIGAVTGRLGRRRGWRLHRTHAPDPSGEPDPNNSRSESSARDGAREVVPERKVRTMDPVPAGGEHSHHGPAHYCADRAR